jgi:hypothetical protein
LQAFQESIRFEKSLKTQEYKPKYDFSLKQKETQNTNCETNLINFDLPKQEPRSEQKSEQGPKTNNLGK